MPTEDWTIGWLIDINGSLHPSFRKKLAQQLWQKAENSLGIKHFDKYDFQLFLDNTKLNLEKGKNQIIANVEFITPTSWSFPIQIIGRGIGIENITAIYQKDISNLDIEFDWGESFPIEAVRQHIKPYRKDKPSKTGFDFDVHYYYYSFPDIELKIRLDDLNNFDKNEVETQLEQFRLKYRKEVDIQFIAVSDLNENVFSIVFDFGLKASKTILKKLLSYINNEFKLNVRLIEIY